MTRPLRISHVITGLEVGGAERMLLNLLGGHDRSRFEPTVISLSGPGPLGPDVIALDSPLHQLGLSGSWPDPRGFARLVQVLRQAQPDVVQTWMYKADLAGGLATRVSSGAPVVWGVRQSSLDPDRSSISTRVVARACAPLSRWVPSRILCVSQEAADDHRRMGYDGSKMVVVPNGFDLDRYRADPAARISLRRELSLGDDVVLVGLVARFHPEKDHGTFALALAALPERPDLRFVLCGPGIDEGNAELKSLLAEAGVADRCHLLGVRHDMALVTAALDVAVSSSTGEGFCNALGEAMACGVPCVATAVGNAVSMIGDTGEVVPPRSPAALAAGLRRLLDAGPAGRQRLGRRAARRIADRWSLPVTVARYEALYREVADHVRLRRAA